MSAGSWLSSAGIGDALASVALAAIEEASTDKALNPQILLHPVMQYILAVDEGRPLPPGALATRLGIVPLGTGTMADTSEGSAASTTNFSATNVAITPARKQFARAASDYAAALFTGVPVDQVTPADPGFVAASVAVATMTSESWRIWATTFVNAVVALLTSASLSAGTSGAALTWDDLADIGVRMTQAGAQGPYLGLLSGRQARDLIADLSSTAGSAANNTLLAEAYAKMGSTGGFLITFGGVDYFLCPELDESGDDVIGGVLSMGSVRSQHVMVPAQAPNGLHLTTPTYSIQVAQGAGTGVATCYTTSHFGVALREAAVTLKIVTRKTA